MRSPTRSTVGPGVSAATRERVLAIAAELGLGAQLRGQVAVGRAPPRRWGSCPGTGLPRPSGSSRSTMQFVDGHRVGPHRTRLRPAARRSATLTSTQRCARLPASGECRADRVDGIVVRGPAARDPPHQHADAVRRGTSGGGGRRPGPRRRGAPRCATDDAAAMRESVRHAARPGPPRAWRGSQGSEGLRGTPGSATRRFRSETTTLGMHGQLRSTDYDAGSRAPLATRDLLVSDRRPTAIVYDNDVDGPCRRSGRRRGAGADEVAGDLSLIGLGRLPLVQGGPSRSSTCAQPRRLRVRRARWPVACSTGWPASAGRQLPTTRPLGCGCGARRDLSDLTRARRVTS